MLSLALLLAAIPGVDGPQALSFDAAIELADDHPRGRDLATALQTRRQADEAISGLAYDPQISLQPGVRWSPSSARGFEGQIAVSQSWSLEGLGERRKVSADRERSGLRARLRAEALERRLAVAHAWMLLRAAEQDLDRVRTEIELSVALGEKLRAGAEAGASLRSDFAEAKAHHAGLRELMLEAEGERVHAEISLAGALGHPVTRRFETAGDWPAPRLPPSKDWPRLVQRAADLPSVQVERMSSLAAEARVAEAAAEGGWRLATQLTFQRESPESYLSALTVGVTLPVFDGNRRARAQQLSAAAIAKVDAAAAARAAARDLKLVLHEVEHQRERLAVLTDELEPSLEDVVTLRQRAYEQGEATIVELLRSKQRLLQAQRARLSVQGRLRWMEVRAWLMVATLEGAGE